MVEKQAQKIKPASTKHYGNQVSIIEEEATDPEEAAPDFGEIFNRPGGTDFA